MYPLPAADAMPTGRGEPPRSPSSLPASDHETFIEVRNLYHVYRIGHLAAHGALRQAEPSRSFPGPTDAVHEVVALQGIDLTIGQGEFVVLVGPNGSGKSTLAHHFNALLLPTSGQVWVDGLSTQDPHNTWAIRQRVGMVFQNPDNQLVASTVEEDVAFGPENQALPPNEIRRRVDEALHFVGLSEYRTAPPHRLSGGQKQLVAIAGALATRPRCIVLDEPTSMLDPLGRQQVLEMIHRLNVQEGLTVILVTQSMDEAASTPIRASAEARPDRVLVMDKGRIIMDGPPHEVLEQKERLQQIGLDVPTAVEIADQLRQRGVVLPPGLITIEALAAALQEIGVPGTEVAQSPC